jgi:hypothetical protein
MRGPKRLPNYSNPFLKASLIESIFSRLLQRFCRAAAVALIIKGLQIQISFTKV